MSNPYQPPASELIKNVHEPEYVGFWARVGASIIDTIIVIAIIFPLLFAIYGKEYFIKQQFTISGVGDILLNYIFPPIAVLLFWYFKSATPGKIALGASIVDAKTGAKASIGQLIGRYLAYYVSLLPLGLGFFWVAWDPKKQGWHDKLADTVVIRPGKSGKSGQ